MTPLTTAKVALTLAAAVLFVLGIRTELSALRWAAIALLTAAGLLRFFDRNGKGKGK